MEEEDLCWWKRNYVDGKEIMNLDFLKEICRIKSQVEKWKIKCKIRHSDSFELLNRDLEMSYSKLQSQGDSSIGSPNRATKPLRPDRQDDH